MPHLASTCKASSSYAIHQASPQAIKATATASAAPDLAVIERLDAIYKAIQPAPVLDRAIRLPEVLDIVGVSKSTWYARLNPSSPSYDPRAPQPFKLGATAGSSSAWWLSATVGYGQACANAQAGN